MNEPSKTDWDRIGAMGDDAIDTSDIPPLSKAFFEKATLRTLRQPVTVTMHVDPDVLAWFQAQGQDYEQRVNAALRLYAEAHQPKLCEPEFGTGNLATKQPGANSPRRI
jgi:uncharacterized protein (DUF4415 family)